MKNIELLIVSPDTSIQFPIDKCPENININQCLNNKTNLTIIYNQFLDRIRKSEDKPEFVIFMHHDVDFNINSVLSNIEKCKNKYDIIGLCGTEVLNVSTSPLNWFTGSKTTPNKRWGCVTHGELGNLTSFFSKDRENITDHHVACIDGLCIIFCSSAINSDIKFNEELKFNCYDTDISLNAILNYKFKIGVVVEQSLKHYSVGKSILNNDFLTEEKILREKFKI